MLRRTFLNCLCKPCMFRYLVYAISCLAVITTFLGIFQQSGVNESLVSSTKSAPVRCNDFRQLVEDLKNSFRVKKNGVEENVEQNPDGNLQLETLRDQLILGDKNNVMEIIKSFKEQGKLMEELLRTEKNLHSQLLRAAESKENKFDGAENEAYDLGQEDEQIHLRMEEAKAKKENEELIERYEKVAVSLEKCKEELSEFKETESRLRNDLQSRENEIKNLEIKLKDKETELKDKKQALFECDIGKTNFKNDANILRQQLQMKNEAEKIHQGYLSRMPYEYILNHSIPVQTGSMERSTTVLIYFNGEDVLCLAKHISHILKTLPDIRIFVSTQKQGLTLEKQPQNVEYFGSSSTLGGALNVMILRVETEFLFYLPVGFELEKADSTWGVNWLLHAMVELPALDLVGGSILHANRELEIPCHRLRMCNWTISKSYEYKRSYGELIICQEAESPFMARTTSLRKINMTLFDPSLPSFVLTDFFYRLREKLVVGIRPEVFFLEVENCVPPLPKEKQVDLMIPFAKKHKIMRFKDSYDRITSICDGTNSTYCNVKFITENWSISWWREMGAFTYPWLLERIRDGLIQGDDLLRKHNITYVLEGGTVIGFLKFRAFLPWDAGDVDAIAFSQWEKIVNAYKSTGLTFTPYRHIKFVNIFFYNKTTDLVRLKYETGPFSLHVEQDIEPPEIIYVRMWDRLYPVKKNMFGHLRVEMKGSDFFEHHRWLPRNKRSFCAYPGFHSCLPDARETGGGTFREDFCEM